LHKFWNDLILGSEQFRSVQDRATELWLNRTLICAALSELAETEFDRWAKVKSFNLAQQQTYQNETLKGSRDLENGEVPRLRQVDAEDRRTPYGFSRKQLFTK
jgi:hypothetical protein